tara:strand:+ start:746 stop:982 length:237 start_codon:yes stop_codon:yes gene_type:complete
MANYGIGIKTTGMAGRYQHEVTEYGVGHNRDLALSEDVIDALKAVNELIYSEMPEGSKNLVTRVNYNAPRNAETIKKK